MRYIVEKSSYTIEVPRAASSPEELMNTPADDLVCDDVEVPYENHYIEHTELVKGEEPS